MQTSSQYPGRSPAGGWGSMLSPRGPVLHRVNFYCGAKQAKQVCLAGDFNHWNASAHPMTRQPDGTWFASVEVRHGHHLYYFVVDGRPELDPKAAGTGRNAANEPASLVAVS